MSSPSQVRSLVRRIFFSTDEPRLRSGWRVLAHLILLFAFLLVFSLPGFLLMLVWPLTALPAEESQVILAEALTVVAFTAATWFARRRIDRRSLRSLGFETDDHVLSDLLVGIAIPGLLMGGIYAFESSVGWLRFEGWAWQTMSAAAVARDFSIYLVVFILIGFEEELICRGYQLQNLAEGLSLPWAVLLSSALFAGLHLANPGASAAAFVGVLAAGIFLAFGWVRTRKLWLPIGLHIGWNFFEGVIFGFPVSGLNVFRLVSTHISGPELVTGGPFGPEAGLVILPAMALGALLIYLYTTVRPVPSPANHD